MLLLLVEKRSKRSRTVCFVWFRLVWHLENWLNYFFFLLCFVFIAFRSILLTNCLYFFFYSFSLFTYVLFWLRFDAGFRQKGEAGMTFSASVGCWQLKGALLLLWLCRLLAMTAAVKSCARPLATALLGTGRGRTTGDEGQRCLSQGSSTMTVASLQVVMEAPFPVDHGRTTELALCPRLDVLMCWWWHSTRGRVGENLARTVGHIQTERKRKFNIFFFCLEFYEGFLYGNRYWDYFSSFFFTQKVKTGFLRQLQMLHYFY